MPRVGIGTAGSYDEEGRAGARPSGQVAQSDGGENEAATTALPSVRSSAVFRSPGTWTFRSHIVVPAAHVILLDRGGHGYPWPFLIGLLLGDVAVNQRPLALCAPRPSPRTKAAGVPEAGVEPARPCGPGGLSPLRLPFRHPGNLYDRIVSDP